MGLFVAALDQTIVASASPAIVGELGGLERYSWTVTAYLLTATASVPLYGTIGELPDRLRLPLLDAFVEGLGRVFVVGVPFAGLGLLLMARVRELPRRETSGLEELESA